MLGSCDPFSLTLIGGRMKRNWNDDSGYDDADGDDGNVHQTDKWRS